MYLGTVQCGHDPAPAAVPDYTGPFPFTGRMERAVISIPVTSARGGEPDVEDSYEALLGD
jgi:hypothetical protein